MKFKEVYWLLGTIAIAFLLNYLIIGSDGLFRDSVLDINVHDTYFVFENFHLFLALSGFVLFTVYFIRSVFNKFRNRTVNLILIIATIFLLICVEPIKSLVILIDQRLSSYTVYPPLSVAENIEPIDENNTFEILSYVLFTFQIILMVLLAVFGFKYGQTYKRTEE